MFVVVVFVIVVFVVVVFVVVVFVVVVVAAVERLQFLVFLVFIGLLSRIHVGSVLCKGEKARLHLLHTLLEVRLKYH